MPSHDQPPPFPSSGSFSLFSHLPQEIQDKIWLLSLPGPRLIEFRPRVCVDRVLEPEDHVQLPCPYSRNSSTPERYVLCVSRANTPAILHVCQYSRLLSRTYYVLSFAQELRRPIYFDERRDRILLAGTWASRYFLEGCSMAEIDKLDYVVLDPLNILTRPLEPGRFPGAEKTVAIVRLGSLYGQLKHIKVLKSDPTSLVHKSPVEIISEPRDSHEQVQNSLDYNAGIKLAHYQGTIAPPANVARLSGKEIVIGNLKQLRRLSMRYLTQRGLWGTNQGKVERLEGWKSPCLSEESVREVMEVISSDAVRIGGRWDGLSCQVELVIA